MTTRPDAHNSSMRFRISWDMNDHYQVRMARLFDTLDKDYHAKKVLACAMLQLAQDFYDRLESDNQQPSPNAQPEDPHHDSQADI